MRVIVIPANIDQPIREESINLDAGMPGTQLRFLQRLVGGWIERVHSRSLIQFAAGVVPDVGVRNHPDILVNEEGLIIGLPLNERATVFYPGETGLHGDAVILWNRGEEFGSLPGNITVGAVTKEIMRHLRHRN